MHDDNEPRDHARLLRRLLVGGVIGGGALMLASEMASAATTATFSNGILTVSGDAADNTVEISRDPSGGITVNGGAIRVRGPKPTVANTTLIRVYGNAGNDTIALDESGGALPRANLYGAAGHDTITGGSGGDLLFGQAGDDVLIGRGGEDFLFGGTEHDVLTGGDANDQVYGESGDDRMTWNPGDDTDRDEGGAGTDTVDVNGSGGAEAFTTTANGTRVRFDRLDPAPFSLDIGTAENLVVYANGGDDSFSAVGNLAALIKVTVDGGSGSDTILGSNGSDVLAGGAGSDFVDGQQGNDVAFLGSEDDTYQWDPGDGSDTVEGQAGTDQIVFNASAGSEIFNASANGGRVLFTRNLGNVVMDLDDVEALDVNALAGTDTTVVGDLLGTDLVSVDVSLAGTIGGTAGDGAADVIVVNGTNGADIVDVFGAGTSASVVGLPTQVNITASEGANDALVVNTLGGNDTVTASTLPAGVIELTIDGGADDDVLLGSQGADVALGGDGDDFAFGDNGNDMAFMGAGDDAFQWDPGDGNDTLEGQDGADSMTFFGSNANESITIAANGGRALLFRDVASVTMDLDDVERIDVHALGGTDGVVVGDLSGTDVTTVDTDLRGPNGGGDGAADTVTVNGTNGADVFGAAGDAGGVSVFGLHAVVNMTSPEHALDRLVLNGLAGDDAVDATALQADGVQLTTNGGLGADMLLGSAGDDLTNGGDGDDIALTGSGDDTFFWNPGDDNDVVEGQGGFDTMAFNGANVAESITVSPNGGRVRLFRDIANVLMDLDDVEAIDLRTLGGADTLTVHDVSGTDLVELNGDLTGANGAGDVQADTVIVGGTSNDDVILPTGDASGVAVVGLAAQVNLTGTEGALDRLVVNALAGDDVVEASGLAAGAVRFVADGGDGHDVLIGSDGDDVLVGGAGDDVILGGLGVDVIDGGDGDDIEIQLVAEDTVVSATAADDEWLRAHVSVVDGTTVLQVGGKARAVAHADLARAVDRAAATAPASPEATAPPASSVATAPPASPEASAPPASAEATAPQDAAAAG